MLPSILVTGASGFIGQRLCRHLQEAGRVVQALVRHPATGPWSEMFPVELGVDQIPPALFATPKVDTVFHLAGKAHAISEVSGDAAEYHRVNVDGTRLLLEAALKAGVQRFVYFSSVKALADPGEQCVDEDWHPAPAADIYGRSKYEAEQLVLAAGRASNMHVCCLRPALVYGPGVKGNLLRMMQAIEAGRFPPVPDTGNRRSLVHVEDLIRAAMLAADKPAANGKIYIVTDGRQYSIREMYVMMAATLGRKVPFWTIPAWVLGGVGHIGDLVGRVRGRHFPLDSAAVARLLGSACYSSRKIARELGYRPTRDLFSTLPEMVEFFKQQPPP
jgi:UDP-glucose 4-epimerase